MKIAFLTAANSWHVPLKMKYLLGKGHDVYYFGLLPGTGKPVTAPPGITSIDIGSRLPPYLRGADRFLRVRSLTRQFRIDILHIIDMNYAAHAVFSKSAKVVLENNGSDVLVVPRRKPSKKAFYRLAYKFADAVVQDSRIARDAGLRYGAPRENNEVIELGIDLETFNTSVLKGRVRKKLNLSNGQKIIFSPRGFTRLYNIETIIKAIPMVKNSCAQAKFIFCRHYGNLEEEYKRLASALGVETDIIFSGFLDNERDMPFYYADADVVVSVPLSDSSPRSVYEAMACGTPVIVSKLPWYEGKFVEDRDFLAVSAKDHQALAHAILKILRHEVIIDKEAVFKKVKEKLDFNIHGQKLEALYYKILNY